MEGEIVYYPCHRWEFNITDRRSVFNPQEVRTRTYEGTVVDLRAAAAAERDNYDSLLRVDEPRGDTYTSEVEDEIDVLYI